jgi:DNA topoisomerase-2
MEQQTFGQEANTFGGVPAVFGGEQYEKMSHIDQIRHRPDTYIGSPAGVTTDSLWMTKIIGEGTLRVECLTTSLAPAIAGISKEAFDNASDNVERSRVEGIDPGMVRCQMTERSLTILNEGKHIPIVVHHKERIWVPQMIFGVLLTSDNYNDSDSISRYKIGRNGYGIKLTNIFSTIFNLVIGDPVNHLKYTQTWTNGMKTVSEPVIEPYNGSGFTQVTFVPDFDYFYETQPTHRNYGQGNFLESMKGFYLNRTMEMSFAAQIVTIFDGCFNGVSNQIQLDYRDAVTYFNAHFEGNDPDRKQLHWRSDDGRNEFVVAETPNKGFAHAFVNGTPVHQGEHVNAYVIAIFEHVSLKFEKQHGKKIRVDQLKKHVSILLRVTLDKPQFDGQIKKKLTKPKPKVMLPYEITKEVVKWDGLDEELRKMFNMKSKHTPIPRGVTQRVTGVSHAIQSTSTDARERAKCGLIITEGETGKTLALKGLKNLPGGKKYNGIYPIRGKTMNIERHSDVDIAANKELSAILSILGADITVDYHTDLKSLAKLAYRKIILMCDADYDAYHIQGLMIKFLIVKLKTLAPFEFIFILMTPVIEGMRAGQRLAFYHQKQFDKWHRENDSTGWVFKYKKGLGSWNIDKNTCKLLFENPVMVSMHADPETDSMLRLAFDKKLTDQRKQWIAGYDPNSECILRTPRPISEFFNEEFRDYSKAAVIRAIPRLMDGMKPVHRKILYCLLKRFKGDNKGKLIKIPQFGGYVMENAGYHHGEQALFTTIIGMGQRYITGPNNLPLVAKEGNFGDRRQRGADQSPARYLLCGLEPIARLIYRKEDDALWEILYDDGSPVEPKEMYPVIPMALVNKCEGIGTGWSTKIQPHDPRVVLEWVRQWVVEKRAKRNLPKEELTIDVATKPELIPWWRDYRGTLVRIKNQPHEVYRNEGAFQYQFHTVFITELPVELSPDHYKNWGEKQEDIYNTKPEDGIFRTFSEGEDTTKVDFTITGMSAPTLGKLNLIRTIAMSNMVLIDKDSVPKKFNYTFEIVCEWCSDRLEIYERRRLNLLKTKEEHVRNITLKYLFVKDVVEGRLEVRNRPDSEIIPYMIAHGYPYGQTKKVAVGPDGKKIKQKKKQQSEANGKAKQETNFLSIPIRSLTSARLLKLAEEKAKCEQELEFYRTVLAEDLWLTDLQELSTAINKLYSQPLE